MPIPVVLAVAGFKLALPHIIKIVDKVFGGGNGLFKNKVANVLAGALSSGIHEASPDPVVTQAVPVAGSKELADLVQFIVTELNAAGELKGVATVVDDASSPKGIQNAACIDAAEMLISNGLNLLKLRV
jgi:hypothetical protein